MNEFTRTELLHGLEFTPQHGFDPFYIEPVKGGDVYLSVSDECGMKLTTRLSKEQGQRLRDYLNVLYPEQSND